MTNLRHLFLKLLAFNFLLSLSLLSLESQAQIHWEQPSQDNIVLSNLNINVYGQKNIGLKSIVNQHYGHGVLHGKKLRRVVVRASAQSSQSRIALMINGIRVTDVRNISYYPQQIILDLPASGYANSNIFGRDINTIRLKVSGNVQIKRIALQLGGNHQGGVLRAHNIQLGGRGYAQQLNLAQVLRASNHNQTVEEIRIVASTQARKGVISVISRGLGRLDSMHLDGRGWGSQTKTIRVRGHASLSDIKLLARGNVHIQSIEVITGRRGW